MGWNNNVGEVSTQCTKVRIHLSEEGITYNIPRDIRLREIQYLNYRSDRYIVSAFQSYGQYVDDKITEEEPMPMEINQHSCCGQGALYG